MAVDDISYLNCDKDAPFEDKIECDFETDFCSWNFPGSTPWLRSDYSGGVAFDGSGPGSDHTTGTGYYVYVADNALEPDVPATLKSPPLRGSEESHGCVRFWYHMFGVNPIELSLEVADQNSTNNLWIRRGSQVQKYIV